MTRTSSISGTLVNRQRSPVRVAAASILRAAFLAPLMATVPDRATPPSTRKTSGATASGRVFPVERLCVRHVDVVAAATGGAAGPPDDDARRRGCAAGPAGAGPGRRPGRRPRGSRSRARARPRVGLPGPLEVDLAGHVGRLGHDHDLVRADLEEPADDGEALLRPALADAQLADAEHADQRGVAGQDAQLALDAGQLHRIDGVRVRQPLGRDDLERSVMALTTPDASRPRFGSRTSSTVPARKNACSGRVSVLPSRISLNEATVSLIET